MSPVHASVVALAIYGGLESAEAIGVLHRGLYVPFMSLSLSKTIKA